MKKRTKRRFVRASAVSMSAMLLASALSVTSLAMPANGNGWEEVDGKYYWYEDGVLQGYNPDDKSYRGKEIYDPDSRAWYWLDNNNGGAKAVSKDVYQESESGQWGDILSDGVRYGKWVRYDENGAMIKGWNYTDAGTYYFDLTYGTMAKGYATIDGIEYYFNTGDGTLEREFGAVPEGYGWKTIDGADYWYEDGIRQGYSVDASYRGKEIYDPGTDAWYWLDNVDGGKKAVSKDVYQESDAGQWAENEDGTGKWVRYDQNGHMIKGWSTNENGKYYFDPVYGTMAKGVVTIDGVTYKFDTNTGVLIGEAGLNGLTQINCVVDGSFLADIDDGQAEFVEQWEAAVGEAIGHDIALNITQFYTSAYSEEVRRMFAAGDYPDVMIMTAGMFQQYAPTGLLWDMADAYDNAEFQNRLNLTGINECLKDSEGHLYGFAPAYGNGCVTYVKQSWLDAVGINIDDIKTFDDYYNMLLAFHNGDPDGDGVNGNTYGTIATGYIGPEAPWVNYLPEFWQDAYPSLLQDDNGVWYDGFQTDATKAAIERIKKGVADGAIDPATLTASAKTAREKWFSNNQTGSAGTFTYWAGTWYQTLTDNMIKNEVDTDLVQLPPIAEVGTYFNRESRIWVIIDDGDGDDSREQAIFDAFIDTMLDGDTVQTLWAYGAEDVHWSIHAEKFTTNPGTDIERQYSYEEGVFHLKPSPSDANSIWKKNAMDPALMVSPLTNGYADASELAVAGNKFFTDNCVNSPVAPDCDAWIEYSGEIIFARGRVFTNVVRNGYTVEDAMAEYVSEVGAYVDQILRQLNSK